jgi:hypothetical protein
MELEIQCGNYNELKNWSEKLGLNEGMMVILGVKFIRLKDAFESSKALLLMCLVRMFSRSLMWARKLT